MLWAHGLHMTAGALVKETHDEFNTKDECQDTDHHTNVRREYTGHRSGERCNCIGREHSFACAKSLQHIQTPFLRDLMLWWRSSPPYRANKATQVFRGLLSWKPMG